MKHYYKNPRKITDQQLKDLECWLDELGDLSGIVHDLNSDEIPAGNQRSKVFGIIKDEGAITLTERLEQPTRQGTVARGYIEWHGEQYGYRQVRWTPEQCERANLIANNAGGIWDIDILSQFDQDLLDEVGFNQNLVDMWNDSAEELAEALGFGAGEDTEDDYSRKIEPPVYTPSETKPEISFLFNDSVTKKLVENIEQAEGITNQERDFLKIAAQRHTVLNFQNIADYYAHSSADMQRLMEDNALVIIDFNKAIEQGFVELSFEIANMVRDEHGDE